MLLVPRRARGFLVCLGVVSFASMGEWAAWAQGTGGPGGTALPPASPPVTYSPMRRPGASSPALTPPATSAPRVTPRSPAPTHVPARPAPAPVAPPPPSASVHPYAPYAPYVPAPVAVPAPAASYAPYAPYAPAPVASPGVGQPAYVPYAPYAQPVGPAASPTRSYGPARATSLAGAPRAVKAPVGTRALGVGFDVGAPDGANLGLVLSPANWVRMEAAFGTNSASLGYRGGVTFVPVGWGPSFSFEAGHCNMAQTNGLIRSMFGAPKWVAPYVQELGYTYFNAHLGLDLVLGNVTLFLHGGYTYLMGTVRGSAPVVIDNTTQTKVTLRQDGEVHVHTLSAKLGLTYMFGGS